MQSNEDPGGLATALEGWFTIEDSKIVRLNVIEIVVEEEQQCISNQEFHSDLEMQVVIHQFTPRQILMPMTVSESQER